MEAFLGQTSRFMLCTRYTTLTEELSKLATCPHTKILVVSCLSSIVEKLSQAQESKLGIERAMIMVGNLFHEIYKLKKVQLELWLLRLILAIRQTMKLIHALLW